MDLLNAFIALLNYVVIPATTYGSQLAFGALGVTLISVSYTHLTLPTNREV